MEHFLAPLRPHMRWPHLLQHRHTFSAPSEVPTGCILIQCGLESAVKTASVFSISERSVYASMCCISQAFQHIQHCHLAWPGELCHEFLSKEMETWRFPSCLGSEDGSYIHLMDWPTKKGYAYWCCKKFYAVHNIPLTLLVFILTSQQLIIQATVDHHAIFISYDFGWPDSVQDSQVFYNSHLWWHHNDYFWKHEYILVDKVGYSHWNASLAEFVRTEYLLTHFSIWPFTDYDLTQDPVNAVLVSGELPVLAWESCFWIHFLAGVLNCSLFFYVC